MAAHGPWLVAALWLCSFGACAIPPERWSGQAFAKALEDSPQQAEVFAPGQISDGLYQRDTAWSSSGTLFLYTVQQGRQSWMMLVEQVDGQWLEPQPFFAGDAESRSFEPAFQPETELLYFVSDRPLPGETERGDFNIWRIPKTNQGWGAAEALSAAVNGEGNEFYPSLTAAGDLYFTAAREGGIGGEDLWVAHADGTGFATARLVEGGVNLATDEFNAAVDADGTALVFGSVREDGPGGGDLYFSLREADGTWSEASLLAGVNTSALDFCPFFDPHGDHLWFSSTRMPLDQGPGSWREQRRRWQQPGNGFGDLFRVPLPLQEAD